jgi:hypothetical protein
VTEGEQGNWLKGFRDFTLLKQTGKSEESTQDYNALLSQAREKAIGDG